MRRSQSSLSSILSANRTAGAFTLIELLVVLVIVALLAVLLIPAVQMTKMKSLPVSCHWNLKQTGLAARIWAGDHNDLLPMQVCTNQKGGLLFADATNAYRYFEAMSNELTAPTFLSCPADKERPLAQNWAGLSNSNLSYFIGLDANETQPSMLLAGDRNLTNGTPATNGILSLTTNRPVGWTMAFHGGNGNVALADGSVQQLSSSRLMDQMTDSGTNLIRLLMP